MLHPPHHADHLAHARSRATHSARSGVIHPDLFADGALPRPIPARGFLIDNRHRRGIRAVAWVEKPPLDERSATCPKEVGARPAALRGWCMMRFVRTIAKD